LTLIISNTVAAILEKSSNPLIISEIELPSDLLNGQVLVEVITSGICGAQINEIEAVKGPDKFLPHLLGHEGFAKVLQIGPGVKNVAPGDQVVLHWRPGIGIQSLPPVYKYKGMPLNAGWVTTFNNHSIVSENRITKISSANHDKNIIPLLGCALTTALGVLKNDARVSQSDSLLIFGVGGVGLLLIKIAKILGIENITVVDIFKEKLEKAMELGASKTILFTDKNQTSSSLLESFGSKPPTVVIDTTGITIAIEICYEISAPNARVILVGVPTHGKKASIYTLPLHFGKILKGSEGGHARPERDIPYLLKLIDSDILNFNDYPTQSCSLNQVNDAISQLKSGLVGRMIIDFSKKP
jgi:S-(hydroxymethyl)glutathione dehydrogenase/alcohol dehydrogenase